MKRERGEERLSEEGERKGGRGEFYEGKENERD